MSVTFEMNIVTPAALVGKACLICQEKFRCDSETASHQVAIRIADHIETIFHTVHLDCALNYAALVVPCPLCKKKIDAVIVSEIRH